jgi:hypothetical protein
VVVPGRRHEPVRASDRERVRAGGQRALDDLRLIPYSHTGSIFYVVSGSNGNCGGSYLCTARSRYVGLGTPNGSGGF